MNNFKIVLTKAVTALNNVVTVSQIAGILPLDKGGTGASDTSTAQTNLGFTTVGKNLIALDNTTSNKLIRINADKTITLRTASEVITDIGAVDLSTAQTIAGLKTFSNQITGANSMSIPYNQKYGWGGATIDPNWRITMSTSSHPVPSTLVTGNRISINTSASGADGVVIGNSTTGFFELTGLGKMKIPGLSAPASSTASGVRGELTFDSNYIYVCVADNTWKRANLTSW